MSALPIRYSKEEVKRRGHEVYEQTIKPQLGLELHGYFVAIDIESGDYEVSEDPLAVRVALKARRPNAWIWGECVGFTCAGHTGYLRRVDPT